MMKSIQVHFFVCSQTVQRGLPLSSPKDSYNRLPSLGLYRTTLFLFVGNQYVHRL